MEKPHRPPPDAPHEHGAPLGGNGSPIGESEQKLARILECMSDGVWDWDLGKGECWLSPRWLDSLGYTEAEMPPEITSWERVIHPDDLPMVREALREHLTGESPLFQCEYRVLTRSGGVRWRLGRGRIVERDGAGTPLRIVGTDSDISDRKGAEQRARDALRSFETVIQAAPVAIIQLDTDRRVTLWNPAAERMFGWASAEVLGLPLPIVPAERIPEFEELQRRVTRGEAPVGLEFGRVRKDGSAITVSLSCAPIADSSGRVTGMLEVIADISGYKGLEEQLRQAQRLESIGRLAGGVAHDFNNLLTVINGYSEMLIQQSEPKDPSYADLVEIRRAGERAAELTSQLLAFSRRQVVQPRPLDLNAVVTESENMLRRLIGEDVKLLTALDQNLGRITADKGQITQILMNLAVNARDAMPGGGTLRIETRNLDLPAGPVFPQGPCVTLSISDGGVGMDSETLTRIFEPFFTTKERGRGTGLGLATVYGIVKQGGGDIQVESRPGHGSTFRITFPRLEGTVADAAPADAPRSARRGVETILVVEDEADVRRVIAAQLRSHGYRVLEASSGAEALLQAEREEGPIHLLLADVVMPNMTGPDLAGTLSRLRPGLKLLFMSGYAENPAAEADGRGAESSFLQKPFAELDLLSRVRGLLDTGRRTPRILVADDEEPIRRLLQTILASAGFEVVEAANGREALRRLGRGDIDLLIVDLVMPIQDGIETLRVLGPSTRRPRIIAVSGAFGGEFLKTASLLGADATLVKPIHAAELVATVRDLLGHPEGWQEPKDEIG